MPSATVELAQRAYERFNAGDVAGFLELLDPDVEWVEGRSNLTPEPST